MSDLLNKKITFPQSQITIKINQMIYSSQTKIYLCTDIANNSNTYCLKAMHCRSEDKTLSGIINTEIILMMSLKQSNNIVSLIDYITEEKSSITKFFVLMEYCSNGSLNDYISKVVSGKNLIQENQIWKIAMNLAIGLNTLHNLKYAHRDLKPENILVSLEGYFKIADFSTATNRFYENINNHNRNEIIFDISKNTTQCFRAPEQVDLYTGYPINEKVDLWALGIILYNLAFDIKPFSEFSSGEFNQFKKADLFTEEMINSSSPHLIELLKMLLKINPKERASASEVISFIEKNVINNFLSNNDKDAQQDINLNKFNFNFNKNEELLNLKKISFSKIFSDATAKLFKRHSTQFWVLKLTNDSLDYPPKFKYIKNLVIKSWQKRQKVVKVYINLSSRPLHFISSVALKAIYVLHHYLFLGPLETLLQKEFNLEEFIYSFINLWGTRLQNENYDKEDHLKNPFITKFIVSYAEFLKAKISFHKKYPFVENNFSLDLLIKSNQDLTMLIEKKFINDLLSHFSFTFQKIVQIPTNLKNFSKTINLIIQMFNEELVSMHSLLFYVIVAYKKYNSSNKIDNSLKAFDSPFNEISLKVQELFDRFEKYRSDTKSMDLLINLPNNSFDYLKNLESQIKFFPVGDFNLRIFFSNEIQNGVMLNSSIGRLVDSNSFDRDYLAARKKMDFLGKEKSRRELNANNNNNSIFFNKKHEKKMDSLIYSDPELNDESYNNSEEENYNSNIYNFQGNSSRIRSNSNINLQKGNMNNLLNQNDKEEKNNEKGQETFSLKSKKHGSNSSVKKLDNKKPFDFSDEKFLNSKRNFDFDSVVNIKEKNQSKANDFQLIFSNANNNMNLNKNNKGNMLNNTIRHNNNSMFLNKNSMETLKNKMNVIPLKIKNNFTNNNSKNINENANANTNTNVNVSNNINVNNTVNIGNVFSTNANKINEGNNEFIFGIQNSSTNPNTNNNSNANSINVNEVKNKIDSFVNNSNINQNPNANNTTNNNTQKLNQVQNQVQNQGQSQVQPQQINLIKQKEIDNQGNNQNQSLFNHNFFSKNNNLNQNEANNNNNIINNESFCTAVSKLIPLDQKNQNQNTTNINQTNEKNLDANVMNVLNEIFDSNKSDLSNINQGTISNNPNINMENSNIFTNTNTNQNNQINSLVNNNFINNSNLNSLYSNSMGNINITNPINQNNQSQMINKIPTMNFNQNNLINVPNQNFFNFYGNQVPNNLFYQQFQQNSQLLNQPNQPNQPNQLNQSQNVNVQFNNLNVNQMQQNSNMNFNPNLSEISNSNMTNDIYDTDKVKKTLQQMDKVYNDLNNINNNASNKANINNNQNIIQKNIGNFNNANNANANKDLSNPNNNDIKVKNNFTNNNNPQQNQNLKKDSNTSLNQLKINFQNNNNNNNNNYNKAINNTNQNPNETINNNKNNTKASNVNANANANVNPNPNPNNNLNNQIQIQNLKINPTNNLNQNKYQQNQEQFHENKRKKSSLDENVEPEAKSNKNENNLNEDYASQYKSDVSNINIFNIETHINNISVYKEEPENDIEKIANDFLCEQLSKGNMHWLISSKDIDREKQIGFGGSSEVYKGNYRGTEVAIKKLRILEVLDENLKEFKREISSLVMLRHPNLVLFMGAIAEKDNICIVTEYCVGGTLFNILHQKKELIITWELRLRILYEIAVGMNFLHTNNPPIIHRDLKSLNILLTEKIERPTDNTKIKISDFGLSKIIRSFDSGKQQMTGQLGTCHWMAPEVIENKNYTLKADVFSFGIIIWEICSRKTPYSDMTQQQISFYVTVKKGRPDKTLIPHNAPPAIIKLMEVCWDPEPNNRPSFCQIIEYLKKIKL